VFDVDDGNLENRLRATDHSGEAGADVHYVENELLSFADVTGDETTAGAPDRPTLVAVPP
jgi:hypothetical protein